ncbi:MAG: hypothetical protein HUJ30_05575, partial [Gammaproteobacteria bacterium]|nr:hypothetical protein [Gammaproteobacteria bacterium]
MNTQRNKQFKSSAPWYAISTMVLSILVMAMPQAALANEAGKVIFVFGQAWKSTVDGGTHAIASGMSVEAGERRENAPAGQVQMRKKANGLNPLRPGPQL